MGRICFSNKSRKNYRQRCFEGSTGRCFHMCRRCQVLLVTRNNTEPSACWEVFHSSRKKCMQRYRGWTSVWWEFCIWHICMRVTQLLLVSTKSVKVGHLYDHCEDVQSKVYNSKPKSTMMCTENSGSGMCCAEYRILPLCSALTATLSFLCISEGRSFGSFDCHTASTCQNSYITR